jgi:hypothetical protein
MSAMSGRSKVFTACTVAAVSFVAGAISYSISVVSAASSAPAVVVEAAPSGRASDCIGSGPDLEWYQSRGEMLPDLVSFNTSGMVRGEPNPCGGDDGGGNSPCSTDPFAGADGLGDRWVTGFIAGGGLTAAMRPTSDWDDLSVVFDELGGVGFVGGTAINGCMTVTASFGAYISDTATNVIFSLNMNTVAGSTFINGSPFVTPSSTSITGNVVFPDLDFSGSSDVTADWDLVVYTLRWFPQGSMSGSPNVYTFASD